MSLTLHTKYLKIDPRVLEIHKIRFAARILARGGVVAFPTETVYGLGANALDGRAVRRIFRAKGRPQDNPLIVHVADLSQVYELVADIPPLAAVLIERFWPGPLTLIFPRSEIVPLEVTAGLDTIGIRMPAHPVALALIKAARLPLAAPSANLSGRPSPTTAHHVLRDLRGKIDAVVDAGPASVGVESTVLDLTTPVPVILRPGGVTREELQRILGRVELDPALVTETARPKSPGLKYSHYAPKGELFLIAGEISRVAARISRLVEKNKPLGLKIAVLLTIETAAYYHSDVEPHYFEIIGSRKNLATVAARLFAALRNCDRHNVQIIFTETFPEEGLGLAIMNRLRKAAARRIIYA